VKYATKYEMSDVSPDTEKLILLVVDGVKDSEPFGEVIVRVGRGFISMMLLWCGYLKHFQRCIQILHQLIHHLQGHHRYDNLD